MLHADNAVLIADGEGCIERMVNEHGMVCGRRKLKLKVNVNNRSKVLKMLKSGEKWTLNMLQNGWKMDELDNFGYPGVYLSQSGGMEAQSG